MQSNLCFASRDGTFRKFCAVTLVALLLMAEAVNAEADDWNIVPSLSVRGEYDDNLFYTADKIGDFRAIFMPGIGWQEKTERLDATIVANLKGIKYADKKQFDTVDYGVTGNFNYQYMPRVNISAGAQYSRDSSTNRDIGPLAIVLNTVRSYQQHYSLQGGYAINEKTTVVASYSYAQFNYLSVPVQSTSLSSPQPIPTPPPPPVVTPPTNGGGGGGGGDNGGSASANKPLIDPNVAIHAPSLSLARKFNELTQGSLDATYAHYTYKYSMIDNYETTLTLNRALNELWSISVAGGGRFTRSEFASVNRTYLSNNPSIFTDTPLPPGADRSWGWVGRCALNYNGLYSGGSLSLSRDVATGQSSANEITAVVLDTRYKFTEEFGGTFSAGYTLSNASRGEFAGEAVDDRAMQFSAGLRYDFTKDISLDGGYSKVIAKVAGTDVGKNYAFINLTIRCPLFR